jgi:hypothetical protein
MVGGAAERVEHDRDGDRERVLGRRPEGLEAGLVAAEQLTGPDERVDRVVVRVARPEREADDGDDDERRETGQLELSEGPGFHAGGC